MCLHFQAQITNTACQMNIFFKNHRIPTTAIPQWRDSDAKSIPNRCPNQTNINYKPRQIPGKNPTPDTTDRGQRPTTGNHGLRTGDERRWTRELGAPCSQKTLVQKIGGHFLRAWQGVGGVGEVKVFPKSMHRGTHYFCDGGYRTRAQHKCKESKAAFRAFVMADT